MLPAADGRERERQCSKEKVYFYILEKGIPAIYEFYLCLLQQSCM
jgi:hypothetical protein